MDKSLKESLESGLINLLRNTVEEIISGLSSDEIFNDENVENQLKVTEEALNKLEDNFIPNQVNEIINIISSSGFKTPQDIIQNQQEVNEIIGKYITELNIKLNENFKKKLNENLGE